jgi:biotin transport system substrate-specific component
MAVSANIFIYLPGTPVPITLQTVTVLVSAVFLGSSFAFLSQVEYLVLGIAGMPVFAGFKSSIAALTGPTGGYLLGFLLASYISGYVFEKYGSIIKNKIFLCLASFALGLMVIYSTGYIHLLGFISAAYGGTGTVFILSRTFDIAVKPFIIVEVVKLFIVMDTAVLVKSNLRLLGIIRKAAGRKDAGF